MLTDLTPPSVRGSIILNKNKQQLFLHPNQQILSMVFKHCCHCSCNIQTRNQRAIIGHLKINCGQSQIAWSVSPDYTALGRKSLMPSDGSLQLVWVQIARQCFQCTYLEHAGLSYDKLGFKYPPLEHNLEAFSAYLPGMYCPELRQAEV